MIRPDKDPPPRREKRLVPAVPPITSDLCARDFVIFDNPQEVTEQDFIVARVKDIFGGNLIRGK